MNLDVRKLNCGVAVTERMYCAVCGEEGTPLYCGVSDRLFDVPGTWDVLKCDSCNLVWMKQVPLEHEFSKVYVEKRKIYSSCSSKAHSRRKTATASKGIRDLIKNCILKGKLNYIHIWTVPGGGLIGKLLGLNGCWSRKVASSVSFIDWVEGGRLLDIGCGNGDFMERMRKLGWKVFGVDLDRNAVEEARKAYDLDVAYGTVEYAGFRANSFDAVTLSHVIEHLPNPVETLKEINRVLKPGGMLAIKTPNIASLCHKRFGRYWYHLDVPRHVIMFSPKALEGMVTDCGFKRKALFTSSANVNRTFEASRLIATKGNIGGYYRSRRNTYTSIRLEAMLFQVMVNVRLFFSDVGEEIVLVCRKVS